MNSHSLACNFETALDVDTCGRIQLMQRNHGISSIGVASSINQGVVFACVGRAILQALVPGRLEVGAFGRASFAGLLAAGH